MNSGEIRRLMWSVLGIGCVLLTFRRRALPTPDDR
nr:MAG TPA: hypothetical protein [Caudoviricetes sp.]